MSINVTNLFTKRPFFFWCVKELKFNLTEKWTWNSEGFEITVQISLRALESAIFPLQCLVGFDVNLILWIISGAWAQLKRKVTYVLGAAYQSSATRILAPMSPPLYFQWPLNVAYWHKLNHGDFRPVPLGMKIGVISTCWVPNLVRQFCYWLTCKFSQMWAWA